MNNPFAQIDARLSNIENLILSLNQRPTNQPQELEEPINIKEVSRLTELSIPTLYGYVQRNEVPHYKKGNRLKFFKTEIIFWVKEGKVKTVSEIEADADAYLSNNKKGLK
ncbi:helix-turn-helix domain-containing protein [Tenacibaculum finnmarkense]|uniref:helix-turn-helix domain-containing protein n=1 Tax=Tenacibaculum finnmarkense TaxID=2781243 RepID=UPI000C45F32C|nr:helix-turn-helix domain-containing protein [Tenacibaculum finnmarkense]MCG8902409.1 helix-turn-helix domain-containing protein [Tenacibaculum finnmarkense]SOS55642.1 DNA binding domain-containing protein, excisionase family [Tenacibaculum finnmarkense]